MCSWSVELLTCGTTKPAQGDLIVHNETHCPRFSVVNKSSVAGVSFKYTVRISNDLNGVVAFLNRSTITCCIESCDFRGSIVDDSIVCAAIRTPKSYFADNAKVLISYIYVTLEHKKLQFDDDADHYYAIYDRDCATPPTTGAATTPYETTDAAVAANADDCAADAYDCGTCLWNDGGYKHYLQWCPRSNPCTGSYLVYDRRDVNGNKQFLLADKDVVRIRCAEVGIWSVRPLYVARTGGGSTAMTMTVRNHRMLAENRTVTVTVAGRRCEDPVTHDDQTVTCAVPQPPPSATDVAGPVEIVYSSTSPSSMQLVWFALRSSENVEFVDPEVTSVDPSCGPATGGTTLTVRGQFLDAGTAVHVSIVTAAGEIPDAPETVAMTCNTVSRDRHTIVCRTAAAGDNRAPSTSARVKVQFDGGTSKYGQSSVSWTVCGDGGPAALDARQTFVGTVSGGTALSVRGIRFSCAPDAEFYVHDGDGAIHAADCRAVNDTYMVCRSPDLRRASLVSTVAPGVPVTLLDFGVRARDCEGRAFNLQSSTTAERHPFTVYADPVYIDFEIRDGAIVINRGDHTSYLTYVATDVVVRFQNSTGGCDVESVTLHEIVCTPTHTTAATVVDRLRRVVVIVGGDGGYACDVQKKSADGAEDGGQSLLFTNVTFSCCRGVAFVSAAVLLFAVGVLLFRTVAKDRYIVSADI